MASVAPRVAGAVDTPMLATPGSFGHYLYQLRGDIVMQSQISNQIASSRAAAYWRSRLIVIAVITTAVSIYLAGIFWFGRELAEDVRAGVREVRPGLLVSETER